MKISKNNEISPQKYVEIFYKKMGINSTVKPEHFWRQLTKKFGKIADEFGDCVEAREKGENVNPYILKNSSMEFANAIASQFDSAKIKEIFTWFINQNFDWKEKKIIEIGCDNGILLCLFASIFHESQFIGIDPCEQAILLAKERAKLLDLKNIEFHVSSADKINQEHRNAKFDFILAFTVFHEILGDGFIAKNSTLMNSDDDTFSITDVDKSFNQIIRRDESLVAIKESLTQEGKFISVDRWVDQNQLLKWIRLNEKIGLNFSLTESVILQIKQPDSTVDLLPLSVLSATEKPPLRACDILSFRSYPTYLQAKALQKISDQVMAELLYESFDKTEFYFHKITYNNGSGTLHTHMGVAQGIGYIYTTTNTNFRELIIIPSALISEKISEVVEARINAESYASVEYKTSINDVFSTLSINIESFDSAPQKINK
jgi:hypothetical protein